MILIQIQTVNLGNVDLNLTGDISALKTTGKLHR